MKYSVVVAHVGKRKNSRKKITVIRNSLVDDVINSMKRKPDIPHSDDIIAVGIGDKFIEKYMIAYKCKTYKDIT